jgi:hypothetical protein
VSRETHRERAPSASPFGLPGPRKGRGFPLRGDPSRGAGLVAPTAPHATPPAAKPKGLSGPARFWDGGGVRIALAITLALSIGAHWFVAPWNLLPTNTGVEFKDPAGELSIAVDVLAEESPPPPEPKAAPPPTPADPTPTGKDPTAPGRPDAGAKIVDAGKDAAEKLAEIPDAGVVVSADGGAITDAGEPDGSAEGDGGLVAMADAGGQSGSSGARSATDLLGGAEAINAGVQNVVLGVNVAVVRKHPIGARMGPILQAIPQWKDFMRGAQAPVDPIRDTEWILIYGPSLIHTEKDAVLVRYNVSDDAVDATIAGIARSYDKGGPLDAGVPGVTASLGFADNAQRAFLRPRSKLLVIVPPSHASQFARAYKSSMPRGPSAAEAMRLIVHNPANQISIPNLRFPQSLTEIRLWIIPRADGGADVFAEGDCTDEAAAVDTAEKLTEVLKRVNSLGVRFATRGLLNNAVVTPEGSRIKLHVLANAEQLEAILQLTAASVNAQVAPPSNAGGGGGSGPSPTSAPSRRE